MKVCDPKSMKVCNSKKYESMKACDPKSMREYGLKKYQTMRSPKKYESMQPKMYESM